MKSLQQEIQEQIDELMKSKCAKTTDNLLFVYSKLIPGGNGKGSSIQKKRVIQFDLDGNYIQTFDSVSAAAKQSKRDRSSIIKCIKGETKQSGGFIWKYEE